MMRETDHNQSYGTNKRHCMVVHAYYPLAETRVQREAEALVAQGFEVDVISLRLRQEPNFEIVRGVNVYRMSVKTSRKSGIVHELWEYLHFLTLAALKLTRLHRQKQYRVIQVHNLPDFLVFCALIPKLGGTPIILDIHDVSPELFLDRTGYTLDSWLGRLVTWQEKISCRFANHVITVTEPWRQLLINRGVPQEKISVVMNIADAELFHPSVRRQANKQQSENSFHLIYHGVQTYSHGLDLLLQAIAKVRPQIPKIRFTLHGNGVFHKNLVNLAQELQLTDCVDFSTRFVPVSELPGLIVNADIGVVPYRNDIFSDGILPTKLMEYVSLGMPAIAARTSAVEAYFDETMVELFTPNDPDDLARSLVSLYANKQRINQLIEGTEKFRTRYDWAKLSGEYVTLVEQLGKLSPRH